MNTLIWFRRDLRLHDNPALDYALKNSRAILPIVILPKALDKHASASQTWEYQSIQTLKQAFAAHGSQLFVICSNDPLHTLQTLSEQYAIQQVVWNRLYEPENIQRDTQIKFQLKQNHIQVKSFNGSLLKDPWEGVKKDGMPYRVFTPYWKNFYQSSELDPILSLTHDFPPLVKPQKQNKSIQRLADSSDLHRWQHRLLKQHQPGEKGAQNQWHAFLKQSLDHYHQQRDFPALGVHSKLSAHLHFGEISPRQIALQIPAENPLEHPFARQLVWREFAYHLLYHFPQTPKQALNPKFADFPWQHDPRVFEKWKKGETGYPIIDAGMRELRETGFMHNRVRMIVASFLVKNLLIPWQHGAAWFEENLCDHDLANNTFGWQWAAGCGADAAPYFRIFNPITQSQKFDKTADYITQWLPELKAIPETYRHTPWSIPSDYLQRGLFHTGTDYPKPIIDIQSSRQRALSAYHNLSQ